MAKQTCVSRVRDNRVTGSRRMGHDVVVLTDYWPLLGLRLKTPRLELRLPSEQQLGELAAVAGDGIHDPELMPFLFPWTDAAPDEVARSVVQHHWARLGDWKPDSWSLNLTVLEQGEVAGQQTIGAKDFATLREAGTGSWLGQRFQGRGIGTQMRAAVLHLAFAGLGATDVVSAAFTDNPASYRVSEKLGYEPDGIGRYAVRGQVAVARRVRLTRDRWLAHQQVPVTIEGLEPCLPLFGLTDKPDTASGSS